MVASGLLLLVLVAVFDSLDTVSSSQAFQADRSNSLTDMRNALNRMTKDLRQATAVDETASTASTITFTTYLDGTSTQVVYDASGTTLTRKVGTGTAFPVLKHLASTNVFTYTSASGGVQWVSIDLKVTPQRSPDTTLELDSQVNLRNRTTALTGS
jgi:type II secretory pathway component PulJ